MKYLTRIIIALTILATVGCSMDTIPPAHKGKILSPSGYEPDVLETGKVTTWFRDELILLDVSTKTYSESVAVILADKLTLKVDVKFRGKIGSNPKIINSMFNDIVAGDDNKVSFGEVYAIYGKMIIRNKTREIISQYTVEDVHKNYGRLSKEIAQALVEPLKKTPLQISDIALGNIKYPKIINDAVEGAKARELSIKKEEANAQIALTKKRNEAKLEEANYQIEITKAKAIRDYNIIIGKGITPNLLKLKQLEIQSLLAENAKTNSTVFMPLSAMGSVGSQVRMYSK